MKSAVLVIAQRVFRGEEYGEPLAVLERRGARPSILARAGLREEARVTASLPQQKDVIGHGAVWPGDDVTVDGHIVTANGPGAAAAFGEALGDLMGLKNGEATP